MKNKSILEVTLKKEDHVINLDNGTQQFVIEYKSGCAECTIATDKINPSEAQKTDIIRSVENKFFICLCDEVKIDES